MITKFIRKRVVNTALPFSNNLARVQVYSSGSETFKFIKKLVSASPITGTYIAAETGQILNTETGNRLILD